MKRGGSFIMALAAAALLSGPMLVAQDAATQTTGNRRSYVVHRAATAKGSTKKAKKKGATKKASRGTAARATSSGLQPVGAQAEGAATSTSGRRR